MDQQRRLLVAIGADAFVVALFAAAGRRTHQQSGAFGEVFVTALPFLIGLAAGWIVWRAWRRPMSVLVGLAIWPVTVLAGLIVRRWAFDRGTAASFVVVTTLFLGACFVGWRLVAAALDKRRRWVRHAAGAEPGRRALSRRTP